MANLSGIAVDAMGSDLGPSEIVAAVALAVKNLKGLDPIMLVGNEAILQPLLNKEGLSDNPNISIIHASEVIEMHEKPLQAFKRKKDSSMVKAINLVKEGQARVVVSCGNTGSLMAGGTIRLRPMEGIERPALASFIPNQKGHCILIDAGANPDSKPENLVHNAILGSHFCRLALGKKNPTIGLLSIGTEEGKGNVRTTETHQLLKKVDHLINYAGPIEGFHVFDNSVDVILCDGFTGNILLKSCESLFKVLSTYLKDELMKTPLRKAGAFLSKGAYIAMKDQLSPERYGGAPLLGLKGNILKAHGSSNRHAVMSAIGLAHEMIANHLNEHILKDIAQANAILRADLS
ncbi:MAG: phosphate acyltransferase PlsX [Opitutaceae bacterium]|nr:phosphate acyltransferase PlsX [Opitutaceae bacterium]